MHYVTLALDWIEAHPTIFALVIMPVIGAIVSWLGKPRTPEEFARMPYVVAQLLRVWSAVFPDPNKVAKVIGEMLTRKKVDQDAPTKPRLPPDPPSGAGGLGVLALALALSMGTQGCGGDAKSPARESARAAVVVVAEGVKVADEVCAQAGAKQKDAALLKTCADAYDTTRASLLAAESAVDAWDAGDKKSLTCALAASVRGLAQIANAVTHAGVELPLLVTDALTLGAAFAGGSCK